MTISLTLVPSSTPRPSTIDAIAMGLGGGSRYNVRLDGSTIATARATKGGVLAVGVAISSTARFGSHTVELRDSANRVTLATAAFTVAAVVEPPPPPPPPPPTGMTYTDFTIPASFADGADCYKRLGAWIATVPNGADATHHSRIIAPPGARYLIVSETPEPERQAGFQIKMRKHMTLWGGGRWRDQAIFDTFTVSSNDSVAWQAAAARYAAFDPNTEWIKGAQIDHRSPGRGGFSALFFTEDSEDIRVTGWTVDGGDANVGKPHLTPPYELAEQRSLFYVRFGSNGVEFDGNFADRGAGFGLWAASDSGHQDNPPRNVKTHHNYVRGFETHPAFVTCIGFEAHHEIVKDCTGSAFDIEAERTNDQIIGGSVKRSVYDTYAWGGTRSCWLGSIVPNVPTVTVRDIEVDGLLVPRGPGDPTKNGNYPGQGGFAFRIEEASNVRVTNCYSLDDQTMVAGGGRASVKLANLNGVTIRGNTQKLSGGAPLIYPPSGLTGTVVLSPNP